MRRFITVIIIICFFMTIIPAFTENGKAYGKTVFQKLHEDIGSWGKESRSGRRQTSWTSIFRRAKRNISEWAITPSPSKALSLRGRPAELKRRRGL